MDLFADEITCKVPTFFSQWFCPSTSGINAFSQRWDCYWDASSNRVRRHMGFSNGPFELMGSILRKIIDSRADVALVYPAWPRYWQQLLMQLRQQGVVKQEIRLDTSQLRKHLFVAGPRAPQPTGSSREPSYAVHCAFIIWPKAEWLPKALPMSS